MDILKRVESEFVSQLPRILTPTDFEVIEFSYKSLKTDVRLLTAGIICLTFVINKRDRYYVFVKKNGMELLYTRPKKGYLPALLGLLAHNDFTFHDKGGLHDRGNVCGKLCEGYLNYKASLAVEQHIALYAGKVGVEEYSVGFKVTHYDYYKLNFNLDFELVVKQTNGEFIKYLGDFIQGKFNSIVSEKTNSPWSMVDVFNKAIL